MYLSDDRVRVLDLCHLQSPGSEPPNAVSLIEAVAVLSMISPNFVMDRSSLWKFRQLRGMPATKVFVTKVVD